MGLDYEISYKKGKENTVADALSRQPAVTAHGTVNEMTTVHPEWLKEVVFSYNFSQYTFTKGVLRYGGKVYVGSHGETRKNIIWELHDSPAGGHSGQEVTLKKVTQFFHWPKMKSEIVDYVRGCDIFQRIKSGNQFPRGLLQPLPIPDQVWQHISLDFVEGLPRSADKDCIMVVIDSLTKVGHFIALSHPYSATTVAQLFLDNIYRLHGMPQSIVSDRDKIFTSHFWKELFTLMGTKLQLSTSYHPESDGQTEWLNRCLEQYLRAMTSQRPRQWAKWLPLAEWWYNTTYNSSIKMSLYEALYGVQPRQICVPSTHRTTVGTVEEFQVKREAMDHLLKGAIQTAQNKYKQYADKKRREATLEIGDWVFLKLQPYRPLSIAVRKYLKLSHRFFGP